MTNNKFQKNENDKKITRGIAAITLMPNEHLNVNGWTKFCNDLVDFCKANSIEIIGTFHKYVSTFDISKMPKNNNVGANLNIGHLLRTNSTIGQNVFSEEYLTDNIPNMVILVYGINPLPQIDNFLKRKNEFGDMWIGSIVMHAPSSTYEVSNYISNELKMDYNKIIIQFLERKLFGK